MANNKPFKIKNGLSAKVYLQSSSALSASDVDVSAGSYFSKTLTANTTLTFSNPPASGLASSFALEITGASVNTPYDLANGVKLSPEHSFASTHRPFGLTFKPDGTKVYINSHGSASLYEYSLSTAWDITTLGTADDSQVVGFTSWSNTVSTDGTKIYAAGSGKIKQWTMTTAWDLSTAGSAIEYTFPSNTDTGTVGVFFKSDGTELYMIGYNNRIVYRFTLTTPWVVNTASYSSVFFDASTEVISVSGLFFTTDGLQMYIPCYSTEKIYKYALSTAWDITTASYTQTSLDVASVDTNARSIWIKPDGTRLYMNGDTSDKMYEFNIAAGGPATVSYPSSVKWPEGTAPDAPAAGEKDVYVFITSDGGSNYYGKQAGDAVA
tara:strand:- start:885 stop:2024 length:1140 start_codon:yes stop_codon:yes gene_type:complete